MRWPVIHGLLHSALMLLFAGAAFAQAYPSKPVRLIVPQPPGGGADIVARLIAQKLAEDLKQQVVVDNRAGAGALLGMELAAHATPDGYNTILVTSSYTINAALYPKLPYDTLRDFAPISMVATLTPVLVVNPASPAKSLEELIALARAKPGGLKYGSAGHGNTSHIAVEWLQQLTGTKIVHVPYKGEGPAAADLLAGQLDLALVLMPTAIGQVRAGKLRALAVGSARPGSAGDWTEFRGPGQQGHAEETGLPLTWGAEQNVVWKTDLPGLGWSSPAVAGGMVVVGCDDGSVYAFGPKPADEGQAK